MSVGSQVVLAALIVSQQGQTEMYTQGAEVEGNSTTLSSIALLVAALINL